jgi:sugar phosphate isomerase/epimerase
MQISRRQFIKASITCTVGMTFAKDFALAAQAGTKLPIGFQLYTVRGEFEKDVPGTLKAIAGIGYKAVEFWGYGGTPNVYQQYSAAELRKLLDQNNLKCCGIHLELKALEKDNLQRTIDNNHVLGNEYLNVAAAQNKMGSEDKIAELADFLNDAAQKCRSHKMSVGYHAHPFDFVKINGRFAWDLLFSRTQPEVNMQMDVGNCLAGNGDPIGMLKKFPGRTPTMHIKEYQEKTFDSDYYKEVFQLAEGPSRTKWYIVEMGSDDGTGVDVPRQALEKLHRVGK